MLGLVTIGQSPREDVVFSMFGQLCPPFVTQAGALDGMGSAAIARLAPERGDHVLVSRVSDGREVTLAKHQLIPLIERAIQRCERAGADIVCVLCTGDFPTLAARVRLVLPDRLVLGLVDALFPRGTLGVLIPHESQHGEMLAKWTNEHRNVVTAAVSPYGEASDFSHAAREVVDAGAAFIVMDCMGYDRRMQTDARAASRVPVILSNGVVGSILREMFALLVD